MSNLLGEVGRNMYFWNYWVALLLKNEKGYSQKKLKRYDVNSYGCVYGGGALKEREVEFNNPIII